MKHVLTSFLFACATVAVAQNPNPIRVNQVGYEPTAAKSAAIEQSAWAKRYTLTEAATGREVWRGKAVRTAVSPWSGKKRAIVDFSSVTAPGDYILSAGRHQQHVVIAPHPYRDLSIASIKAFYLQRSGEEIKAEFAGEYARPAGHPDDHVMVHPSAASEKRPAGTIISSPGGWYDAGDYNKYVVNSAFAVCLMLDAYEMCPDYYKSLNVNIPESSNALPDLLDEIAVNVRWMMTMQDPDDGGVYHKLTTPNFESFIAPTECRQQRYVVQKSTAAALDFAATMAKVYRIYSQFPECRDWAAGALAQGKRAFEWAKQHPTEYYRQDEMNKHHAPAVSTGTYGDNHVDDERFWASLELFLATGQDSYIMPYAYDYQSLSFSNPSWAGVGGLAFYSAVGALKTGQMPYASEIRSFLRQRITAYADECLSSLPTSCFDSPVGNLRTDFGWGCNSEQSCGKGIALLYAYSLTNDAKYLDGARKAADYMLGRNATGYCFVTGFGTFSPQHPHHRLSESDAVAAPLPGFLVGGPNPQQQDIAGVGTYPSDYPDESYADVMPSYASNEIAINWNAALVAFIGWLDSLE